MGKKFAQRQRERDLAYNRVVAQWASQLMLDAVTITLNDPEVMGKGVFGKKRLAERVLPAIIRRANQIHVGLERSDEAEYTRIKTDERIRDILGEYAASWYERYQDFPPDEVYK